MKKLTSIILLSIFFVVGCQDDKSILEPTMNFSEESSMNKGRIILPSFIQLPPGSTLSKIADEIEGWTVTQLVRCEEDTKMYFEHTYEGGIHGVVRIFAAVKIYAGTLNEDGYITMNVNEHNGTITLESSQVFHKTAELYARFDGLDLYDVEEDELSFGYLANDGSIMPAKYVNIGVVEDRGSIELQQGIVSQFTTYGFTSRDD
jgi:hypothetical protein